MTWLVRKDVRNSLPYHGNEQKNNGREMYSQTRIATGKSNLGIMFIGTTMRKQDRTLNPKQKSSTLQTVSTLQIDSSLESIQMTIKGGFSFSREGSETMTK